MQLFQQRVIDEKVDLSIKLDKLNSFIRNENFKLVEKDEQERLVRQQDIMSRYLSILSDRISHF